MELRDQQCQMILKALVHLKHCSQQQAVQLWVAWRHRPQNTSINPAHFLQQQGVAVEHLQQAIQLSKAASIERSSQAPRATTKVRTLEFARTNLKLAQQLRQEGLVAEAILVETLQQCSIKQCDLGQTLVRNRHLKMADLARVMQGITADGAARDTEGGQKTGGVTKRGIQALSRHELQKGQIFGKYKVLGEIARGGMGIVYRAVVLEDKKTVALKILNFGEGDSSQLRRFLREVKVTESLQHPNIIPIYDVGEEQGTHYFTMKLIRGETFREMLEAPDVPLEAKLNVIEKMCRALDHAHQKKILHRDIKPSNILIDKDGEPYLTDFGLAKVVDSKSALTQTGTALGTPYYMSPEQVKGEKNSLDGRSDIYSLGVVMYQVLTGKFPFQSETVTELYRQICEEEAIPPSELASAIPENLEAICLKCLAKSPQYRYSCAIDMARDLSRHRSGRKASARGLNIGARLSQWRRRNRKKIQSLLVASIVFALLFTTIFGGWMYHRSIERQKAEARAMCLDAERLLTERQYTKVVKLMKEAIDKDSSLANAHLLLGRAYHRLQKSDLAARYFAGAMQLAPQNAVLGYHTARYYCDVEKYQRALALLDTSITLEPQNSEYYHQRAIVYKHLGMPTRAEEDLRRARNIENLELAQTLRDIKVSIEGELYEKALTDLASVLRKHPRFIDGYLTRADLYYQRGELAKALEDISQAVEIEPNFARYQLRGKWLIEAGYFTQARKNFEEALTKIEDPEQRMVLQQSLADALLSLREYQKAYEKYLPLYGKFDHFHYVQFAQAAFHTRKYEVARKVLQETLQEQRITPDQRALAFYYRGSIYTLQKKNKLAIRDLEYALEQGAKNRADVLYALGKLHLARGDLMRAASLLEKAAQLRPRDVRIWHSLAKSCEKELSSKAILAYSKCIELAPWLAEYYKKRGEVYSRTGEFLLAEQDYIRCLQLSPEDFSPMLSIIEDFFKSPFVGRFQELRYLVDTFSLKSYNQVRVDLFQQQREETARKYVYEPLRQQQRQEKAWDLKKTEVLLQGLTKSDSPVVIEMARGGLLEMYAHPQLSDMIERRISELQDRPQDRQRLAELQKMIDARFIEDGKFVLRQLLVRYYEARDEKAFKQLYETPKISIPGLYSLVNSKEDVVIRFLAAQALRDLCLVEGYEMLQRGTQQQDLSTHLLCAAALAKYDARIASTPFEQAVTLEDPFLRAVAARFFPEDSLAKITPLLKDSDLRVRLYAAQRLSLYGDSQAEQLVITGFGHDDPTIRAFCTATFWDFDTILEKIRNHEKIHKLKKRRVVGYLDKLLRASSDDDALVRRIAALRLSLVMDDRAIAILRKLLKDPNEKVRFQAIITLSSQALLAEVVPITTNREESLLFRVAAFIGARAGFNEDNKVKMLTSLPQLFPLLSDPDVLMRSFSILMICHVGREIAVKYVLNHLSGDDPNTILAILGGLIGTSTFGHFATIQGLLKNSDKRIQTAAAAVLAYACAYENIGPEGYLDELSSSSVESIRKGVAAGLTWPLYRKVFDIGANVIKERKIDWERERIYYHFVETLRDRFVQDPIYNNLLPTLPANFDRAVALDPGNHLHHFLRGFVYSCSKKYHKSAEAYELAVRYRPQFPVYQTLLAESHIALRNFARAREVTAQTIKAYPWKKQAVLLQITSLKGLNHSQEAIQLVKRAALMRD